MYYDRLGLEFEAYNPAQHQVLLNKDRFPLVIGGERGGKALHIETPIPTPGGWKRMADIKPGDFVFGDHGCPVRVTAVTNIQYNRSCSKITFDDGTTIIADDEHEWATQTANERKNTRRKKLKGKEQRVKEGPRVGNRKFGIRTTKEISESLLVSGKSRGLFSNHTVVNSLPVIYHNSKLEIDPYTFGVWLGDGNKNAPYITTADEEVVDYISGIYTVKKLKNKYLWKFGNKNEILPLLKSLNVFNNKHIPDHFIRTSIDNRIALLQGLMDSDGYIDSRGQCYFDNTNKAIIDGMRMLLSSLGVKSFLTESRAMFYEKDCGPSWTVFFVADFPVSRLQRKNNRQKLDIGKTAKQRSIVSVEPVDSVPVKCIEVNSDSHLYLVGESYIPTHNSFVTAALFVPHIAMLPVLRRDQFYKENGELRAERPLAPNFVFFGPTYDEPRVEFSYLEEFLLELDMVKRVSKPTEGRWRLITDENVVITTWSTDNTGSIRGIDLDGAAACEAGNMDYDAIERIQGRIGAKRGFLVYSGTMENANRWYINMSLEGERGAANNKWRVQTYKIPSWSNRHEFPGGREDPEIKRWEEFYTEDVFLARVAAEPQPPKERVVKEATVEHARKVTIPRNEDGTYACDFHVCIDPGYQPSAYAALFVASWDTPKGKFWYVFDELYQREIGNLDAIAWLKKHKFWKYIKSDGITIDAAVKRHSDGNEPAVTVYQKYTGKTPKYKYWHENGLIERIRTTFKADLVAVHPNCVGFLAELGLGDPPRGFEDMHPWKYHTDKNNAIIINDKPIDRHNHSVKAFGYLLLRHLGLVERLGTAPQPKRRLEPIRGGLMRKTNLSMRSR